MSEIEVEKVTLDKLSIFQELNIQTFAKLLLLIIPKKNFNSFSMIVTL